MPLTFKSISCIPLCISMFYCGDPGFLLNFVRVTQANRPGSAMPVPPDALTASAEPLAIQEARCRHALWLKVDHPSASPPGDVGYGAATGARQPSHAQQPRAAQCVPALSLSKLLPLFSGVSRHLRNQLANLLKAAVPFTQALAGPQGARRT